MVLPGLKGESGMKHYNTKFIREYIEQHKEQIESVECFMREDWSWTCDTVFKDGEFCKGFDWKGKYLEVAGITGSTWATPTMEVEFKDGRTEIIECWIDDGERVSERQIMEQKAFAAATGGMDYRV